MDKGDMFIGVWLFILSGVNFGVWLVNDCCNNFLLSSIFWLWRLFVGVVRWYFNCLFDGVKIEIKFLNVFFMYCVIVCVVSEIFILYVVVLFKLISKIVIFFCLVLWYY